MSGEPTFSVHDFVVPAVPADAFSPINDAGHVHDMPTPDVSEHVPLETSLIEVSVGPDDICFSHVENRMGCSLPGLSVPLLTVNRSPPVMSSSAPAHVLVDENVSPVLIAAEEHEVDDNHGLSDHFLDEECEREQIDFAFNPVVSPKESLSEFAL